ncbi:hypothetical protein NLJ89_g209 [Agrocybe chaxingu]|uniref:F-box domain-containing protein n=1 Tax=Agrocybe chaxingu TaxID=84603 RepID=A0A9W8TGA3_9AGAR|nr:hypothetical protein NLJ89_g209 [Agrocybe chaxingu]
MESFSQPLIHRLSPELLDKILGNLDGSREDLAACSTVCKAWLPVCRYYLFAEVNCRPDLARHIKQSTVGTYATADTISPSIRRVNLKGPIAEEGSSLAAWIFRLPRLTELRVTQLTWSIPALQLTPGLPSLYRLLKLTLQYVHLPSFSLLATTLDLFPALEELSLDNVSWDAVGSISDEDVHEVDATPQSSPLRKLRIAFCHNRVLLNWFHYGLISDAIQIPESRAHRPFPHLGAVSLPDILPEEGDIFGAFLATLGESLEYLAFGILVHEFDGRHTDGGREFSDVFLEMRTDKICFFLDFSRLVSLSQNTGLKALGIHQITLFQFPFPVQHSAFDSTPNPTQLSSDPVTFNTPYAWIALLLSTLRSSSIENLTLHMWLSAESQLDLLSWSDLCEVLAQSTLCRVRFRVSGIGRNTENAEEWIRRRLRDLGSTGPILEFEFSA